MHVTLFAFLRVLFTSCSVQFDWLTHKLLPVETKGLLKLLFRAKVNITKLPATVSFIISNRK